MAFAFLVKSVKYVWYYFLRIKGCIHDNHSAVFGCGIHRLPTHVTISCVLKDELLLGFLLASQYGRRVEVLAV